MPFSKSRTLTAKDGKVLVSKTLRNIHLLVAFNVYSFLLIKYVPAISKLAHINKCVNI